MKATRGVVEIKSPITKQKGRKPNNSSEMVYELPVLGKEHNINVKIIWTQLNDIKTGR